MSDRPLVVLKFGSSILRSESDLPVVAEEIKRHHRIAFEVGACGGGRSSLVGKPGASERRLAS